MFNVRSFTAHGNTFHEDYQLIKFGEEGPKHIISCIVLPIVETGARETQIDRWIKLIVGKFHSLFCHSFKHDWEKGNIIMWVFRKQSRTTSSVTEGIKSKDKSVNNMAIKSERLSYSSKLYLLMYPKKNPTFHSHHKNRQQHQFVFQEFSRIANFIKM